MWAEWIDITARLKALTALHIGTGETGRFASKRSAHERGDQASAEQPTFALVATDVDGFPCIPGASFKGALRNAAKPLSPSQENLLGRLGDHDEVDQATTDDQAESSAHAGRALFKAVRLVDAALPPAGPFGHEPMPHGVCPDTPAPPHYQRALSIVARTAIDPGTGTADDHKLFHEQVVSPGAEFEANIRVLADGPEETLSGQLDAIMSLLSPLSSSDGFSIGGGATYGRGLLQLLPGTVSAIHSSIDPADGDIRTSEMEIPPDHAPQQTRRVERAQLTLSGTGPFIVIDAEKSRGTGGNNDDEHTPQIVPLDTLADQNPVLPGESLHGVLRQAALWEARIDDRDHRDARSDPFPDDEAPTPDDLTWTEKLFGRSGWKGLLRIGPVSVAASYGKQTLTSVKLDRFSGGPFDGGLFETVAFIDPVFRVDIDLIDRIDDEGASVVNGTDREKFRQLIQRITDTGLEVGHGASKGFGWFDVTCGMDGEGS
ncbi:MAG: RAMP superfamily CRISPR-associated protein [Pseudomonadota bacterium]